MSTTAPALFLRQEERPVMTDETHPICPNCGASVDPNEPGVVYAVPASADDGEVGGFFHPGCPPSAVNYAPQTLPGADLTTP
jgi:hypothetical protein